MKINSTSSALRVTLSPTEANEICTAIRDAEMLGARISPRLKEALSSLERGSASVRMIQTSKRADRDFAKRIEANRRARERHMLIGECTVMASRADYADVSRDPDCRQWVDLILQEVLNKPIPEQCEIRRDVWLVRVIGPRAEGEMLGPIFGSDCTDSADPPEIEAVAKRIIAARQAVPA